MPGRVWILLSPQETQQHSDWYQVRYQYIVCLQLYLGLVGGLLRYMYMYMYWY